MHYLKPIRFLLPTLLFGYAIVANVQLFGAGADLTMPQDDLLSGGLTRDFDAPYRRDLPHRTPSVGLIGAARYALLSEGRSGVIVGRDGWLFTAEEARPLADATDSVTASAAQIARIRDTLKAAGADLVVVPVPAKIDVARDHAGATDLGDRMAARHAEFVTALQANGIAVADARPALIAAQSGGPVFFETDTHWTPLGAVSVADAVAASGTIPLGSEAYTALPGPEKPLVGDLVSFVTTPGFAPLIGLTPETVATFEAVPQTDDAGLADLLGPAAPEVVLVGTSYSANVDWGFTAALMLALRQDVVSVAEQGLGPVRPMLTYLDSDLYRDTPPKVVIWEFPVRALSDPALWPAPAAVATGSKEQIEVANG